MKRLLDLVWNLKENELAGKNEFFERSLPLIA